MGHGGLFGGVEIVRYFLLHEEGLYQVEPPVFGLLGDCVSKIRRAVEIEGWDVLLLIDLRDPKQLLRLLLVEVNVIVIFQDPLHSKQDWVEQFRVKVNGGLGVFLGLLNGLELFLD